VTMEITADQMFAAGHRAPRGTYLSLETGVVHRLSRPTTLPEGGPFRMVAPTDAIAPMEPLALSKTAPVAGEFSWPEDDTMPRPKNEPPTGIFRMIAAYGISRASSGW